MVREGRRCNDIHNKFIDISNRIATRAVLLDGCAAVWSSKPFGPLSPTLCNAMSLGPCHWGTFTIMSHAVIILT